MCVFHKWGDWTEYKTARRDGSNYENPWEVIVTVGKQRYCKKCNKYQWKFIREYIEK